MTGNSFINSCLQLYQTGHGDNECVVFVASTYDKVMDLCCLLISDCNDRATIFHPLPLTCAQRYLSHALLRVGCCFPRYSPLFTFKHSWLIESGSWSSSYCISRGLPTACLSWQMMWRSCSRPPKAMTLFIFSVLHDFAGFEDWRP